MTFAAPLWLIGLLPWAAVALYLLTGRRREHRVPFVSLWTGPVAAPRPKRKWTTPPMALAAALAAMLLALIAAAGPRLQLAGSGGTRRVTAVIDRGATMSARGAGGPFSTRFAEAAEAVAAEIERAKSAARFDVRVDVRVVPPARPADLRGVAKAPPTALDTSELLAAALVQLRDVSWPIVVVTDRPIASADRVIRVAPEEAITNAGIVRVSVRESPRPQVMVSVRNETPLRAAFLEVLTRERVTSVEVELPAPGADPRDYFVDVPALGEVVKVRLVVDDRFEADDRAWLVRGGSWARIEARSPLGPELARMVEVYAASRRATDASPRVAVVADVSELAGAVRGVVVVTPAGRTRSAAPASASTPAPPAAIVPHPVTRNLEGAFALRPEDVATTAPPDWTPIVRVGDRVAVAVREAPARQVWVGFDSPEFPRRPEYVVFWANVFDWAGGAASSEFREHPVGRLADGWRRADGPARGDESEPGLWPGLFERASDVALRGVNARDVQFPRPQPDTEWRKSLSDALRRADPGVALAPILLVASMAFLALGAALWPGAGRAGVRRGMS